MKRLARTATNIAMGITLLAFSACNTNKKEKPESNLSASHEPIIVDLRKVQKTNIPLKLSDFAEGIQYIPLDDHPLLGEMRFATLHMVDDTFYVDRDNIYKYTPDGKFIKKLFVEGQGPGEAKKHASSHAAFNDTERYCTFQNAVRGGLTFATYSFDGKYLGDEQMRDSLERRVYTYFNNSLIFNYPTTGYHHKRGDKVNTVGPYLFYAKDVNTGEVVYKYPNPASDELADFKMYLESTGGNLQFVNTSDTLWFKHSFIDTLYYTKDLKNIHPAYIFIPPSSFIDMRKYVHFRVGDMTKSEAMAIDAISGYIPLPGGGLLYGLNYGIGLIDASGKASDWYEKPIINDLDDKLATIDLLDKFYNRSFAVDNGYLYFTADAFLFFENGSKPPFRSLTEDSNPVVVKIKLK